MTPLPGEEGVNCSAYGHHKSWLGIFSDNPWPREGHPFY